MVYVPLDCYSMYFSISAIIAVILCFSLHDVSLYKNIQLFLTCVWITRQSFVPRVLSRNQPNVVVAAWINLDHASGLDVLFNVVVICVREFIPVLIAASQS